MQAAVDDSHQHNYAHIYIEPAINNHGTQGCIYLAARRGYFGDDLFQHIVNSHACFCGNGDGFAGVDADNVFHFRLGVVRVGLWQIHFVEHGQHFHPQIQGGVAIGHGLRFHALAGIDHQQGAFASGKRAADFV